MTEIEQAIKYWEKFKQESVEMIAKGKDRNDILAKQVPMCDIALVALREQAERSGCEVCNSLVAMRYETVCDWSDDGKAVWDTNTMHYCPMCGKRLEVEHDG